MTLRVISYGGGVQSTALVVMAAQGRIDFDTALFANVGDDSEHPATLRYVREVATPWAAERGVTIHELHRRLGNGRVETLFQRVTRDDHRGITIPLRGENGAPMARDCTADHKVRVIGKWLGQNGAGREDPATVAVGISTDELERAGRGKDAPWERRVYPLLDLRMDRADCMATIRDAGLPVPPKSACWFCPFASPAKWAKLRRDEPDLFDRAVALEALVGARQEQIGRGRLYLTRFGKPLDQAITEAQPTLFADGPESCDDGYCWT